MSMPPHLLALPPMSVHPPVAVMVLSSWRVPPGLLRSPPTSMREPGLAAASPDYRRQCGIGHRGGPLVARNIGSTVHDKDQGLPPGTDVHPSCHGPPCRASLLELLSFSPVVRDDPRLPHDDRNATTTTLLGVEPTHPYHTRCLGSLAPWPSCYSPARRALR